VRRRASLPRLRRSRPLRRAATQHGSWLLHSGSFQHEGPRGEPFWTRLRPVHTRGPHGEVIAFNASCRARDAKLVVRAWMNSPPHRRVLLTPRFRWVGISVRSAERCGFGMYVADFGS
ncbi:MAG: CAP domain-containing protein, partial [Miltoncostaeaceae bacterium]